MDIGHFMLRPFIISLGYQLRDRPTLGHLIFHLLLVIQKHPAALFLQDDPTLFPHSGILLA